MQEIENSGVDRGSARQVTPRARPAGHGGLWLGTLLIVVGALFLAGSAGLVAWWSWATMWPVLLIALGVLLLLARLS